jgi:phosphoglycerol transferase MdoB-like AlkP superfamily enzyme
MNTHFPKDRYRVFSSEYYLMQQIYHKETFVGVFGSLNLALRDIIDSITPNFGTKLDVKWIEDYYNTQNKTLIDHDLKGVFEGKNLIFILAESYDEIALSSELTPNIYKLKTEGIDFQNHFTPVFPRTTSDMEFIVNVGLIPSVEDGPTIAMFKHNTYSISLPNLFNNKGYHTAFYHGNYKEFYNRDIVYKNYGYHQFYGQEELNLNNIEKKQDTYFYHASKPFILNQNQPFFNLLLTFSGHSPYNMHNPGAVKHYDAVNQLYQNTIPESIKYYIASQMEVDEMLGMLLFDLEQNQILDDTVIIFTGDHYPYTMLSSEYEILSTARTLYEKQKGNLYIWSNQITPRQVNTLSSSFDILPTVAHMFNLEFNINHYVGNDVFSTPNTVVYFKDYVIFDGTRLIRLSDRYESDTLFLEKGYDAYLLSRKVLRTNYFRE